MIIVFLINRSKVMMKEKKENTLKKEIDKRNTKVEHGNEVHEKL